MGFAIYEVGKRWGGYGVPAICEFPDCNEEIDRGISFACGGEPFSQYGCDRYFCEKHRNYHCFNTGNSERVCVEVCKRCVNRKPPFPYKPETEQWVKHLLTDESWKKWREKNPEKVKLLIPLPPQ